LRSSKIRLAFLFVEERSDGQGLELAGQSVFQPGDGSPQRAGPDIRADSFLEEAIMEADRSLKDADDVGEGDRPGRPTEDEAAAPSLEGPDDSMTGQALHDLPQVRPGDAELPHELGNGRDFAGPAGDGQKGFQSVIGILVDQLHEGISRYNDTIKVSFIKPFSEVDNLAMMKI
jgi:hypothetical protein